MSKHWRKPVGRQDQAWIPPKPPQHVTIIHCSSNAIAPPKSDSLLLLLLTTGNRLYAQSKGLNVTNPICWTCKNCSHKCAADCKHYVTQSNTQQFWKFPLNLQSSSITRMLSSGGEGEFVTDVFDHCQSTECQNKCHTTCDLSKLEANLALDSLTVVRHSLFEVFIRPRTFAFPDIKHRTNKHLKPCLDTCHNTWINTTTHIIGTIITCTPAMLASDLELWLLELF